MFLVQVYINISFRILYVNNVNKQSSGVEFDIISVHTPCQEYIYINNSDCQCRQFKYVFLNTINIVHCYSDSFYPSIGHF